MNKLMLLFLVMAVTTGCALEGSGPGNRPGTTPTTETTLEDLASWCATRTPDRCVEGVVYLDWNPGREACVFTVTDDSRRFWDLCDTEQGSGVEPVTTIPTEGSGSEELTYEEEIARRLPIQDERALALLTEVHPDGIVTTGLILSEPMDLSAVENLAAGAGATLISAWRTDYLCFPGSADWPVDTASRFAYLDGVERARQLREEMENSTTPVTGAHIPLNAFAVMEQEALALRQPGVLLEAVQGHVPVASLEMLRDDPRIERVRVADFPIEWIDLPDLPIPACENG